MPGGSHPVAFVFLEVDPALVDFNIHPAKKEARFRNLAELRQLVIGTRAACLAVSDLRRGRRQGCQARHPPGCGRPNLDLRGGGVEAASDRPAAGWGKGSCAGGRTAARGHG